MVTSPRARYSYCDYLPIIKVAVGNSAESDIWSRRLFLAVLACGDRAPHTGTNSHASASASFGWGGRFYALKRSSDSAEAAGALVGIRAPPHT